MTGDPRIAVVVITHQRRAELLRAVERLVAAGARDIVFVALTGWSSASDRARALEAGFDALLSKPADLQALLGAIERATTARRLPTGE